MALHRNRLNYQDYQPRPELLHPSGHDWSVNAACRTDEPQMLSETHDLFYNAFGERGDSKAQREAAAQAICRICPVIQQCGAYAIASKEPFGVWGGMTEDDRAGVFKQQEEMARYFRLQAGAEPGQPSTILVDQEDTQDDTMSSYETIR